MDELHDLRWSMQLFGLNVGFVDGEMWSRPTPCPDWDVRALVNHVVAGELLTAALVSGRSLPTDKDETDVLGDDPAAAWEAAARKVLHAWAQPEALTARVEHPVYGTLSGEQLAHLRLVDNLVHGWDLAQACGFEEPVDNDVAAAALGYLEPLAGKLASAGLIAPAAEVSPDADAVTHLLVRCGRWPAPREAVAGGAAFVPEPTDAALETVLPEPEPEPFVAEPFVAEDEPFVPEPEPVMAEAVAAPVSAVEESDKTWRQQALEEQAQRLQRFREADLAPAEPAAPLLAAAPVEADDARLPESSPEFSDEDEEAWLRRALAEEAEALAATDHETVAANGVSWVEADHVQ